MMEYFLWAKLLVCVFWMRAGVRNEAETFSYGPQLGMYQDDGYFRETGSAWHLFECARLLYNYTYTCFLFSQTLFTGALVCERESVSVCLHEWMFDVNVFQKTEFLYFILPQYTL